MPKQETLATLRASFEQVKADHEDWPVDDEAFRLQVVTLGVQGFIASANTGLPESEERRALVEEMAQWLATVTGK